MSKPALPHRRHRLGGARPQAQPSPVERDRVEPRAEPVRVVLPPRFAPSALPLLLAAFVVAAFFPDAELPVAFRPPFAAVLRPRRAPPPPRAARACSSSTASSIDRSAGALPFGREAFTDPCLTYGP